MLETIQAKSKRTFPPIDPSAIVFFPIRPLVRLCGKRTSLEKNVGRDRSFKTWVRNAPIFFSFPSRSEKSSDY